MAAKRSVQYVCSECGHSEVKWAGKCPSCGTWNSMEEFREAPVRGGRETTGAARQRAGSSATGSRAPNNSAKSLPDLEAGEGLRISSGHSEFDRVLGGGLVVGSTILLGGEPGIGKSTLMLQTAASIALQAEAAGGAAKTGKASPRPVLYFAGEESPRQIKSRADRLGLANAPLRLAAETNLTSLLDILHTEQPQLIIIDSIQTLWDETSSSPPGSPSQLRQCTFSISEWCRQNDAATVFIAHVTKEGSIAGPKIIEHMVDAVLYFEQSEQDLRFLRVPKNRFGTTDEIGLFRMLSTGLDSVADPTGLFLVQRQPPLPAGIITTPVYEGSRILMVEIQALTVTAAGNSPRTWSDRIDPRRISRIAAVLEKHIGLRFSDQDIYINVAGGIRIQEVATDLAIAAALYSARTGIACPANTACTGEISLAGEVRPVSHLEKRLTAARDLGISNIIAPANPRHGEHIAQSWQGTASLAEAVKTIFAQAKQPPST